MQGLWETHRCYPWNSILLSHRRDFGAIESRREFSTARRSLWETASLLTLRTF
jgi:hypothetical protein